MKRLCLAPAVVYVAVLSAQAMAAEPTVPDFQREIMPLLKQRCVACHGPAKQEAELSLALPPGIRRGGENGPVIVAGNAEESILWQRVAADEMPEDSPLPPNEKELLRRWIAGGAPGLPDKVPAKADGDEHWAFQPIRAVEPPAVRDATPVRTDLDRFVQARLESHHLSLGPAADRHTLIRRVSYDLTGLPPTPEEIDEFVGDTSDKAYEQMVDRYLASPRYGERWGKYWLDAAGYADSNGYFGRDSDRPYAFRYRDYVIRSLNADKPWNQFIQEQLAGDEIAGWSAGDEVAAEIIPLLEAVHYLRNSPDGTDASDGNPDEIRRDKYAVLEGTMQIMGSSLLGMTIGCARCHDHKFEPITQRDYYRLQAVLYPAFNVDNWIKPEQRTVMAASQAEIEQWKSRSAEVDKQLAARRDAFRQWLRDNREPSEILFSAKFDDEQETLAPNWSNTAPGDDAPAGQPAINIDSQRAPGATIVGGNLRIVESRDEGDRALSTRQAFDWTPDKPSDWIQVTFDLLDEGGAAPYVGYFIALRDFNDTRGSTGGNTLIDGNSAGGAVVHVDYPGSDSRSSGKLGSTGYLPGHNFGVRVTNLGEDKFRLEQIVDGVLEEPAVLLAAGDLPDGGFGFEYCCGRSFAVDNVIVERSSNAPMFAKQRAERERQLAQRKSELDAEIAALEASRPEPIPQLAVVSDRSPKPPVVPLLIRGQHSQPGEAVSAGGPQVLAEANNPSDIEESLIEESLAGAAKSTGRRLALARWLTHSDSRAAALLARVTVNRWWQYHFGSGIVATVDNLGYSGASPSHPELLEYLAGRFMANGWRAKAVHREILLSATYRQSSRPQATAEAVDPDNHLIWRYQPRRLDAEAIRDAMLRVSGTLNCEMFGPYVPSGYAADGSVVVQGEPASAARRSVYLQQRRTQVVEMLKVFDTPSIVHSCTQRSRTTVPLQSLMLLNSAEVRERAVAMAQHVRNESNDAESFARRAFYVALSRHPNKTQIDMATKFLGAQTKEYAGRDDATESAQADFCQMLLASNPFLYLD